MKTKAFDHNISSFHDNSAATEDNVREIFNKSAKQFAEQNASRGIYNRELNDKFYNSPENK